MGDDIGEGDEDFNPMEQDFNDPKFNSYKSGPGSYISPHLHTQKRWKEGNEGYKLHVSNIPLGINDIGFQNIFSNFGKPISVYLANANNGKNKWGFVTYRTLRQAERAIYSVTKIPPLNLIVKFALTEEAKSNRTLFSTETTPVNTMDEMNQTKSLSDCKDRNVGQGRGLPLPPLQGIKPSDMPSTYIRYSPYISVHSQPLESHPLGEFSVDMNDEIIENYNEALTLEKPVVKNNGKFVLYMGRGYALKSLIDHSERYILDQKDFKFSEDSSVQSQPCSVCGKEAMRICSNCSCWYCSIICFRMDSPNHILDKSGLVICYNTLNDDSKVKSKTNKNNENYGTFVQRLIFPPLKDSKESLSKYSSTDITEKKKICLIGNRNSYSKSTHFIRHNEFDNVDENLTSCDMQSKFNFCSLDDSRPSETGSFMEVKINYRIDQFTYWVIKMSDSDKILELTKKLHKCCSDRKAKHLLTVIPSSMCAALSKKFWSRAVIISRKDQDVRIRLIDYGHEDICAFKNLRILPGEMLDTPPFAFKIRFIQDTSSSKYENLTACDQVKIKPLSLDKEGYLIVSAEDDNSSSTEVSSVSSSKNDLITSETNIDGPLLNNTFSEVVIAHRCNSCEYWVNLMSQWNDLNEMSSLLNMIGDRSITVTSPTLNEIYIKLFDNQWCRAKVICLNPLKVFYIDYGNEEEVISSDELHALPSMLTSRFPPMAIRIKMSDGINEKYLNLKVSEHLRIKPLSKTADDCYIVTVEGNEWCENKINSSYDQILKQPLSKDGSLKHLLYSLETCSKFTILVNQVISKNKFSGSLIINSKLSTLKIVENELSKVDVGVPENFKLGDSVACLTLDGLCARGYLTSIINQSKRVALVDYGYVAIADKLSDLPPNLKDEPEAGVSCTVSLPQSDLQVGCRIRCSHAQLKDNIVFCKSESFGNLTLSIWKPKVEDGGLSSIIIPSGSRVILSSYKTPQAIYVQSLESKHKMLFETLMQDVAAYATTAPLLNREPDVGEYVLCLFPEDQNFYRAQVCRKKGNMFNVIYVDFGNSFDVTLQDMRVLDDSLKMVPCCAVKIGLKGVKESILTINSHYFLNMLSSKETEVLYLEYDESLNKSILKSKEGETLNNKMNDMIDLNWKKCLEEGSDPTNGLVFFGDEVNYMRWDIGMKIKLLIIGQICANCYFVINSQDGLLDFMRDVFTPRVSNYCSSFAKNYSYTPRLREICFVKYLDDNLWYRAVVTNTFKVSCWVVFIDFGITGEVYYKNVRPMTDEFIRIPSILKKCVIEGLPNEYKNEGSKERLNEILNLGSIHDAIITKESSNGSVTAYFGSVAIVAKEIGLPPIKAPKI